MIMTMIRNMSDNDYDNDKKYDDEYDNDKKYDKNSDKYDDDEHTLCFNAAVHGIVKC